MAIFLGCCDGLAGSLAPAADGRALSLTSVRRPESVSGLRPGMVS